MEEKGRLPQVTDETLAYRSKIFDRFHSASYARRNDLSDAGLDRASAMYLREFGRFLPAHKDAPILEIGCGAGSFLAACKTLGYTDVRGFDISEEMVAFCHQRGLEEVVCSDGLTYLQQSEERFALVVASDVLEHIEKQDGRDLMLVVHRRLLPEGRVLLQVPNMSNPLNLQARFGDYTHEVGFSKESLEQLLRNTGFEIETVHSPAGEHRHPLAKLVFDRLLWRLFAVFYRHTLQLKARPERGKDLIAVGIRRQAGSAAAEAQGRQGGYRAAYFDTYVSTQYEFRGNELSEQGVARTAELYKKQMGSFLPTDKDAPILEIGCGSGGFLRACSELGYRAIQGIDISPEQVEFCHEMGFEGVECSDGSSYLEKQTASYGAIVMSDVLEHVPRREIPRLLGLIHDRLLPGGRLIVRVPNLSNPLNIRTRFVDLTHEVGFTLGSLRQVLQQHGFAVESVGGLWAKHRRWLPRLLFDRWLWWAFQHFCRRVMGLEAPIARGKNLLGVGVKY